MNTHAGQTGQTETCWTSWASFTDILWTDECVYLWITVWLIQYILVCMNPLWKRYLPFRDKLTVLFGGRSTNLIFIIPIFRHLPLFCLVEHGWGSTTTAMQIQQRSWAVECILSKSLNLSCTNTTRTCCASALSAKQLFLEHVNTWLQPTKVEVVIHNQPPAPTASWQENRDNTGEPLLALLYYPDN